jgi:hypothetical protein
LYLSYQSRLWVKLDPTVVVTTQFSYDGKKDVPVPFVVGPSMMDLPKEQIPAGGKMVFSNTKVAGLYPYKGGDLKLSVILCQLNRDDIAKRIMRLVDAIASALDYSTQLSSYLKIANVVIDGVEQLMGIDGLSPLIGHATQFNEATDPNPQPGCFTLINSPEGQIDQKELWVVNNQLRKGKSASDSKPFRDSDYVLYTIAGTTKRKDYEFLPFSDAWKKIREDAYKPDEESWKRAKINLSALYMTMYNSPDLTKKQALELNNDFKTEITRLHNMTVEQTKQERGQPLEAVTAKLTVQDKNAMQEAFEILDM